MAAKAPSIPLPVLVLSILFTALIQLAPLLYTAGTLYWPEAYVSVGMITAYALVSSIYLGKKHPEMFERRKKLKFEKGWDVVFAILTVILFSILYLLPGYDFHYGWSAVPFELKALGFLGLAFSLVAIFFVMRENAYLFTTIRLVEKQKVVSTGPYAVVRHPMYASFLVMVFSLPLALGSYYALIPGAIMALALVWRTLMEEKALREGLKGYKEYMKKTKYRLIPHIW
jgi:protein-S-isoprenylcysteine O-methyltransferase Ste14